MIVKWLVVILPLFFLVACDQGVAPSGSVPSTIKVHDIKIELVYYDSVRVTHSSGPLLKSRDYQKVGLGILDTSGYRELYQSQSSYDPSLDVYSFGLDFAFRLDKTKVETPIVVRYYRPDSGFTDVDTTVLQYKYPYANTQVFLSASIVPSTHDEHFQDIALIGDKFYFHPIGSLGLYEYNLSTKVTRTLAQYGSGDHLAADSIYIFFDINNNSIRRYNLLTDTLDLTIVTYSHPNRYANIVGLETYQGFLYCIEGGFLHKYSYDGAVADSVAFSGSAYHLAINNGIIYTANFPLRRIDLATMAALPPVQTPCSNMEGIKIYGSKLYFCDFNKRIVCTVPLQDLR